MATKGLTNDRNADIIPPKIFFSCPLELYIKIFKKVSFRLSMYQFNIRNFYVEYTVVPYPKMICLTYPCLWLDFALETM